METADEVRADREWIADVLGDISGLEEVELRIVLGVVRKENADGSATSTNFARFSAVLEGISLSATATVSQNPDVTDEERHRQAEKVAELEAKRQSDLLVMRTSAALANPSVLKVRKLLAIENATGTELGHIVDLVRQACNGDLSGFASGADLKRFDRSINHP